MNNQENEEMDTTGVLDDIQLDEIICDLSNQDLLQDTPPGSPLVPQPPARMLEELEIPSPFSFLNDYTLPHRAPLLPEIVEQPQQELAAVRNAWAGFDGIRLALASQGAKLAEVTSLMHNA